MFAVRQFDTNVSAYRRAFVPWQMGGTAMPSKRPPTPDHRTTITLPGELADLIDELRVLQRVRRVQLLPRGHRPNPAVIWLATTYARILRDELTNDTLSKPIKRRRG